MTYQQFQQQMIVILIGLTLISVTTQNLIPYKKIDSIHNPRLLTLSSSGQYFAISNQSMVSVYNTLSNQEIWSKDYRDRYLNEINLLKFSQNEQHIGIGFNSKKSSTLQIDNPNFLSSQVDNSQDNKFLLELGQEFYEEFGSNTTNSPLAMIYIKQVILIINSFNLYVIDNGIILVPIIDNITFTAMARRQGMRFSVGCKKGGSLYIKTMYYYPTRIYFVDETLVQEEQLQEINDLVMSKNQKWLYFVGDSDMIYKYSIQTSLIQYVAQVDGANQLLAVHVSDDELVILVNNRTHMFYLQKIDDVDENLLETQKNNTNFKITVQPIKIPSVALKQDNQILYLDPLEDKIASFCFCEGESGLACEDGTTNCLVCVNRIQCFRCSTEFKQQNNWCYANKPQIDGLIIAAIVIGGVLIVGLIVFCIVKVYESKSSNHSPLLWDEDDDENNN